MQGVKKSIFILAEADSVAVKNIQKYSPNAKVVEEVKPIAFGPYHGAYYRRFTKWHVSRFKKIATVVPNNVLSDEQIILMLSALVDAEMSFDEAVEVLEIKTGKRVTIAQVK
ncbi:hypothetical protein VV208B2_45920 (plasmid) [Vibrio vulnificus]|nr:hypothetical protein VV208B2_45920 [Vibrio vulnificus]BDP38247.1 hypothetical protein VA208B3_46180 [Vibrio alginolyticus]